MNKYAIYCDDLTDEQLLKDWIKKEFDSNYYDCDKFLKKKLFFGFPNYDDFKGFLEGDHTSVHTLGKLKDYTKINIKEFLKEYYMKELTELPTYWAVLNDGSQLFKDTVVKYLNIEYDSDLTGWKNNSFYGKISDEIFQSTNSYDATVLTLDQFIKLTTKNMKTQLLGLPIIKGEKHHLEAFSEDCKKLGYVFSDICSINDMSKVIVPNVSPVGKGNKQRDLILLCAIESTTYYHPSIVNIKEFQLPQDWKIALDFMKENMDRWNKIQEENKEPEFKIGDHIKYISNNGITGETCKLGKVWKQDGILWGMSAEMGHHNLSCGEYRKATPQEIEEYNNKPKIFKMTSSSGDFELEVSKKGIYYRPEDKWFDASEIQRLLSQRESTICTSKFRMAYSFDTVTIGCRKSISIDRIKEVYDYYKSIV